MFWCNVLVILVNKIGLCIRLCQECQNLIENHDQIKLLSNVRNNLNTTLKVGVLTSHKFVVQEKFVYERACTSSHMFAYVICTCNMYSLERMLLLFFSTISFITLILYCYISHNTVLYNQLSDGTVCLCSLWMKMGGNKSGCYCWFILLFLSDMII